MNSMVVSFFPLPEGNIAISTIYLTYSLGTDTHGASVGPCFMVGLDLLKLAIHT